jgi:hypothetical protein
VQESRANDPPRPVPDLTPFAIEPLILARLNRAKVPPALAGALAGLVTFIAATWTALASNLFYAGVKSNSWWHNLWLFILHNSTSDHNQTVPYLQDYPAIVLSLTIAASVYLVYSLFRYAAVLHSDMEKSECIITTKSGQNSLADAVEGINRRFVQWGKFAPIVAILAIAGSTLVNFRLEGRLFTFLGHGDLYKHWWASLHPFRLGGVIWIIFGALGIYMVYAEAILGLTYVKFLRTCRDDYRFRANMLNPDGLFGWARIRLIVSNLEMGALCTVLSSWAMWFYLQPALGSFLTIIVLIVFNGVVFYVFISVTWNFRRQVKVDKDIQRAEIGNQISHSFDGSDTINLLRTLVAYKRLELVSTIPSVPIRPRWLWAGAITIVISLGVLIFQILAYFAPGK